MVKFLAYLRTLLGLSKSFAFPSNSLISIPYTGGDVGEWKQFFTYTPTANGYIRIQVTSKGTDAILNIYSGNFGQAVSLPWSGVGMVMTVPCTKGLIVNFSGNDLSIETISFIPSLGSLHD